MSMELRIPSAGESITEVILVEWLKAEGAPARRDEALALVETDKANVEVLAPADGVLARTLKSAGEAARVGEVIGYFEPSASASASAARPAVPAVGATPTPAIEAPPASLPAHAEAAPAHAEAAPAHAEAAPAHAEAARRAPPSRRRAEREAERHSLPLPPEPSPAASALAPARATPPAVAPALPAGRAAAGDARADEVVPMSPLRRRVAARLLEAQASAAMLTTFNEVDLSAVIALRKEHQEAFKARHGVKLGFMSFFVKAAVEALRAYPAVNAEVRGADLVYHRYYDIGVAVGGGKGLVVPVLRSAERLGFAEIEQAIADFGERAKAGRLKVEELQGGTFTVSNGGIYGSMMSTPILNPPQSGILGMHAIQERPVVRGGAIVAAPMMYLALTYDHRIIDGREAVGFLVRVKECIESPARMLLEV